MIWTKQILDDIDTEIKRLEQQKQDFKNDLWNVVKLINSDYQEDSHWRIESYKFKSDDLIIVVTGYNWHDEISDTEVIHVPLYALSDPDSWLKAKAREESRQRRIEAEKAIAKKAEQEQLEEKRQYELYLRLREKYGSKNV